MDLILSSASTARVLSIAVFALAWAGCADPRPSATGEARCTTFEADAAPVLAARCGNCHAGSEAHGDYRVDRYLEAIARRPDGTARATAGDDASPLLAAARGELTGHSAIPASEIELLGDWVVRCRLAPRAYDIHPKGWMDPASDAEFHGRVLRRTGYRLEGCAPCHGADLGGGPARVTCQSCHASGVLDCATCHGSPQASAPPRDLSGRWVSTALGVGAHRAHLADGPLHRGYGCGECHPLPASAEAEGHYRRGEALDELPAEVVLRSAPDVRAVWNRDLATCEGSHCHAPSLDTRASLQTPVWTLTGGGACGTCHGLPPSSHADDRCPACHRPSYSADGGLLPERHADGVVQLSAAPQRCVGCHGDADSSAPPADLSGRQGEHLPSVGAHRAHLEARHLLAQPVECSECHLVPASLFSPGHIDSAAPSEVFPPGVRGLASADGAAPHYEPASGTCTVYCHGAGARSVADGASGIVRAPSWTGGAAAAACGACHGIPPQTATHPPSGLTQCASCHAATVAPSGAIRVSRDASGALRSTHIDGVVQASGP